ncbi:tetratricopeptide repeat protein [Methylocystis parvus]|uniref:Tetratricopeptide repeat protein n=1 Tax=Methylocystis parvus TaxID=134 RepID=A0A6B8M709_9HYPH|nr:tetratricopeptide repeat protein [Methylocystis parvus]QGM98631.1 tetratricopeptide repeat protein [Methylocystis parvus]WBK01021.1 tetratricopeptide repeat protein [Methylocystis parvus OBBP]
MSDIFNEVDEDVRRDKAEAFWRRYQTPIFVVAFLIVAATGAWSYYQEKRLKAAEAANDRYVAAEKLAEDGKKAEAAAAFDSLAKDGPKGYAALARIRAAEVNPDREKAMAELTAIGEDANVDKLTQHIAMLRAALIMLESDDRQKLERALGPLMISDGPFRFSAQEWNGLDALFNDDFDEAERVFEQVLNNGDAPQSMRQRASAYKGLLHAKRGPKPAPAAAAGGGADGGKIDVTPVIEPESGGAMPTGAAPFEATPGK